ncbi:MAG: DNA alkylation repair protein [Dehalococcoidales bacterium]|nr:MAG: DNA alkylation repair protein [Dehalococcoidales bacterium]
MASEQVLRMVEQLAENSEYRHPRELPFTFIQEAATLSDDDALELATRLCMLNEHKYIRAGVIIIERHPTAFGRVGWEFLEPIGNLMDDWGKVDMFACLAGPAWRTGQLSDAQVMRWTHSASRWWRRAALVCTVFLNRRTLGGTGDTPRTLTVCDALASDKDDMVVKGMSWALRDLLKRDRNAVERFLEEHEGELHARVKREVRNKLLTGRKNPPRKRD